MKSPDVDAAAAVEPDALRVRVPRGDATPAEVRVQSLREVEDAHVRFALRVFQGNKKRTAEALGISRDTLYRKIAEFDLQQPEPGAPSSADGGTRR